MISSGGGWGSCLHQGGGEQPEKGRNFWFYPELSVNEAPIDPQPRTNREQVPGLAHSRGAGAASTEPLRFTDVQGAVAAPSIPEHPRTAPSAEARARLGGTGSAPGAARRRPPVRAGFHYCRLGESAGRFNKAIMPPAMSLIKELVTNDSLFPARRRLLASVEGAHLSPDQLPLCPLAHGSGCRDPWANAAVCHPWVCPCGVDGTSNRVPAVTPG